MGWTRQSGRVARSRRRPDLESLETRQLLSHVFPKPASGNTNPDGLTNFDQIIGASAARSQFNVDGTGQTVAVIDTGVDYNNAVLGGAMGSGYKVVAGVDFTGSPNGVLPTWQHGTGVAGLLAGNGAGYQGVAPGADIVALRVFGDNNQGSFNEIASALDWVVQNHSQYNITAVNLSVSDGGNYTSNIFSDTGVGQRITTAVSELDALNIPVVMAAGNSFDGKTQGLGFPAIIPDVVSVTATDASDQLSSSAQRLGSTQGGASAVKIAAPGVGITAPSGDSGTATEDGTSFATPQVTGSIVLLQQMYENAYHTLPTVAVLDQLLQQGAVTVHDGVTGINVDRLNVLKSARILNQQIQGQNQTNSGTTTTTNTTSSTATPTNPAITNTAQSGATTKNTASSTNNNTSSDTATTTNTVSSTTQAASPPVGAAPSDPLTQVFVNGVSLGNYSTAQLEARYPGLFSFLDGPVNSIEIWAPQGSNVDLGPAPASVATLVAKHPAQVKLGAEQSKAIKAAAVVHHAATPAPKKSNTVSSFFSNLFHFKF